MHYCSQLGNIVKTRSKLTSRLMIALIQAWKVDSFYKGTLAHKHCWIHGLSLCYSIISKQIYTNQALRKLDLFSTFAKQRGCFVHSLDNPYTHRLSRPVVSGRHTSVDSVVSFFSFPDSYRLCYSPSFQKWIHLIIFVLSHEMGLTIRFNWSLFIGPFGSAISFSPLSISVEKQSIISRATEYTKWAYWVSSQNYCFLSCADKITCASLICLV